LDSVLKYDRVSRKTMAKTLAKAFDLYKLAKIMRTGVIKNLLFILYLCYSFSEKSLAKFTIHIAICVLYIWVGVIVLKEYSRISRSRQYILCAEWNKVEYLQCNALFGRNL